MNSGPTHGWSVPLDFLSPNVVYQANIIRDSSTGLEPSTHTQSNLLGVLAQSGGGEVAWFNPIATNPPTLTLQPAGPNFQLIWNAGTLLHSDDVDGPWTTNASASPLTVTPVLGRQFYRVKL